MAIVGFLPAILLLAGCQYVTISGSPIVDTDGLKGVTSPRTLGVLPTTDASGHPELAPPMREALHAALSSLPLENRQLPVVDQRLATIANRMAMRPEDLPPAALAHPSVADIVVFSKVEHISRLFLLLYAHNRFVLDFQMVDTRSRRVFYRNEFVITSRNIAPTLDILGLFSSAFRSLWHLRTESVRDTFDNGAQKIVAQLPALPVFSETGDRLAIVKSEVKLPKNTLGPGDRVQIQLTGTPKMNAAFSVGKVARRMPMREAAPGKYRAEFTVRKGMNTPYAVVETTLRLPNGSETITDTVTDRPFSIDTTPPPRARVSQWWPAARKKGVWAEIALEPADVKANPEKPALFVVSRRAPGRKDFVKVAETKKTTFLDQEADPNQPGEYRIVTRDTAGNASAPGPITKTK